MNNNKRKMIITAIVTIILAIVSAIWGVNYSERDVKEISDSVETVVNYVDNATSTTEIVETTETEEQTLEVEQEVESDAVVEQENIAYNGSSTGNGLSLLGECTGLTYYSQADSRWANYPYTATNNSTQTMKSSACGPTSAAMVVSSSKGSILPTTMSDLFVQNGFRTANSGTAWSAYSWIADYFNFNDYKYTSNYNTMLDYLSRGYYVIASCGSGLFTYGGHYIVLVGVENGNIKIYDPYLYTNKFNTASRRNKVTVNGNTVYCSIDNFKKYANYKGFWCFSNDSGLTENKSTDIKTVVADNNIEDTNYKVRITASSLRVREGASTNYTQISSYKKGTVVTIYQKYKNWGKTASGWICLDYTTNQINSTVYTTGKYKVSTNIHVRMCAGTNYKAKTYKQLTQNARYQNKLCGNYYYNGYKKGVICNITKVHGNWGLTKSGWICLDYCKKI
jgi:hypothetical protein